MSSAITQSPSTGVAMNMGVKKIIGVVQPTYLPWLPFFERMARSDVFIYLDDVKYSKNSFHNRNAIKSQGGRMMLTIPILYAGNSDAMINEIAIDNRGNWRAKHLKTIQQCYARAEHYRRYKEQFESLYANSAERLIDFIMPIIEFLRGELGIATPCHLSSQIPAAGVRNEKLVNLCKHFGGTHFIVKPGTEEYHPTAEFGPFGIQFHHLQYTKFEYPQQHGLFEPLLSAIDYLLNCGPGKFIDDLNTHVGGGN